MFLAIDEKGTRITAAEANKHRKYFCPVCRAPVTFKSGNIKMPHFSHHRILDCIHYLYKNESIAHLQSKHALYLKLADHTAISMEHYLPEIEQIPDLLVANKLALEIQFSIISAGLIVERSKGYHSLGMEVIWLLDEASIRTDNGKCMPTHFQLSTMYRGSLFTYSTKTDTLHRYILLHDHGCGRWSYKKIELVAADLLQVEEMKIPSEVQLTKYEIGQMIGREKQQKSVLNPTLSFMYQLGLDAKNIPEHLSWSIAAERWILNPPLEWKLFIYHGLERGTFDWRLFENFIQMREIQSSPPKQTVLENLLKGYYLLYNSQ